MSHSPTDLRKDSGHNFGTSEHVRVFPENADDVPEVSEYHENRPPLFSEQGKNQTEYVYSVYNIHKISLFLV